jgi:putative transposase
VNQLVQAGYPVVKACAVLDLPRSSYYYVAVGESVELRDQVRAVAEAHPVYGSRRITAVLRREPYNLAINRKYVQRVMKADGLLRRRRRRVPRTTQSDHGLRRYLNLIKGCEATHPNEIWVADITYIRLGQAFVYLAIVLDVCTRVVRGWCLSRHLDEALSLEALRMALAVATPEIHHSDQGVQYAATGYVALLESRGVRVSMSARHSPHENGFAERFMRTVKEEEVDLSDYRTFAEAHHEIGRFIIEVYNRKRVHSSLGYLTPVEFEEAHGQVQAPLIGP